MKHRLLPALLLLIATAAAAAEPPAAPRLHHDPFRRPGGTLLAPVAGDAPAPVE